MLLLEDVRLDFQDFSVGSVKRFFVDVVLLLGVLLGLCGLLQRSELKISLGDNVFGVASNSLGNGNAHNIGRRELWPRLLLP